TDFHSSGKALRRGDSPFGYLQCLSIDFANLVRAGAREPDVTVILGLDVVNELAFLEVRKLLRFRIELCQRNTAGPHVSTRIEANGVLLAAISPIFFSVQ